MKVIVGKYSGFCAGVNYTYKRAVEELNKGPLYCLGEIIHNKQVIEELENKGMTTVNKISDVPNNSSVIFRAHGEPYSSYEYAIKHNIKVIDLTCGKVKLIHDKVNKMKDDYFIVIIGKKTHPEIIGTLGFSGNNAIVIEDDHDIPILKNKFKVSEKNKIYIISQTTFSSNKFDELVLKIKKEFNNVIEIDKSICNATQKRQDECEEISKNVQAMIVIGSKHSSNTRELFNIASKNCKNVYYIEEASDLEEINLDFDKLGVVAGASAPKYLIDSIVSKITIKKITM